MVAHGLNYHSAWDNKVAIAIIVNLKLIELFKDNIVEARIVNITIILDVIVIRIEKKYCQN